MTPTQETVIVNSSRCDLLVAMPTQLVTVIRPHVCVKVEGCIEHAGCIIEAESQLAPLAM